MENLVDRLSQQNISSQARTRYVSRTEALLNDALPALQVDPFTLPQHQWRESSQPVRNATGSILSLYHLLLAVWETSDLAAVAIPFTRRVWFQLVAWTEFIHPANKYIDNPSHSSDAIAAIILGELVAHRSQLSDLLAQTPRVYRLLADSWLHGDKRWYSHKTALFDRNPLELYGRIVKVVMQALTGDRGPPGTAPPMLEGILEATNHRPKRIYKRAMACLMVAAQPPPYSAQIVSSQLTIIFTLANDLLPLASYPRNVIRSLVRWATDLKKGPQGKDLTLAYRVVECMWLSAQDDRPLVWALRDGIMPLMMAANQHLNYELSRGLELMMRRSIFVPVARALASCETNFEIWADPQANTILNDTIKERLLFVPLLDGEQCSNPQCGKTAGDGTRLSRCPCLAMTYYCSVECQKAHRPAHQRICHIDPLLRIHQILDKIRAHPIGLSQVQFMRCNGVQYTRHHGLNILAEIDQFIPPDSSLVCVFQITIDFEQLPSPSHTTFVADPESEELYPFLHDLDEHEVVAVARLSSDVSVVSFTYTLTQLRELVLEDYRQGH